MERMAMGLAIANVARVREAAVQAAVVPDGLVYAAVMMDGLGHRIGAGLRLHGGFDAGLRHRGASLRRGPGFNRERGSGHAKQGGGRKYQGKFPHGFSPWSFVGEQVVRSLTINVVVAVSFRQLQIWQIHEPALIEVNPCSG
jgi:hypothetical protein